MSKNINNELEINVEETNKRVKREITGNQENITNVNEYIRFVTMSDGNRRLEKLNKYKDGSEDFVFEGWYGSKDDGAMFRRIICLVRDNKLKQKQVNDLQYYIKCFEEAKEEIINYFRVEL